MCLFTCLFVCPLDRDSELRGLEAIKGFFWRGWGLNGLDVFGIGATICIQQVIKCLLFAGFFNASLFDYKIKFVFHVNSIPHKPGIAWAVLETVILLLI